MKEITSRFFASIAEIQKDGVIQLFFYLFVFGIVGSIRPRLGFILLTVTMCYALLFPLFFYDWRR